MCCKAVDAEALWKRRPTKLMSGKFPYYFLRGLCFFFPTSRFIMVMGKGHALEFSVKSGLPGTPVGSGCAAASVSVPQPITDQQKHHIIQ